MKFCIGFGEREGRCENEAGTPWTPLWCIECDEERRAHITAQLERMVATSSTVGNPIELSPSSRGYQP